MITQIDKTDNRRLAKFLYWQGWSIADIADYLNINARTCQSWKHRDGWDTARTLQRIEAVTEHRIIYLLNKEQKSNADYKEIDCLSRQLERYARIGKYQEQDGNEADLNPNLSKRRKGKKFKNHIPESAIEKLKEVIYKDFFEYQKQWLQHKDERTRIILKSRQIGATWYFAREALGKALFEGRNQIFLSASKNQAFMFKSYIVSFVRQTVDIELKGSDVITFENEASLHFLGTNSKTAQSYHGDLYIDEFFWIPDFVKLNTLASGMAAHKQWTKTYFSTPSTKSHPAYNFWTGEAFSKRNGITIDTSHEALKSGVQCQDRIWRQIVNIYDAEKSGCDLFDIEHLKNYEYSEDQFANLFECEFIDDTESIFSLQKIQSIMVDAYDEWPDYNPLLIRPFDKEVWIGYDPSVRADGAGLAIIAPPTVKSGKFRILEALSLKGLDFEQQADKIKEMTDKYRVSKIAIDTSGIGEAVYQLVIKFFPSVVSLNYTVELKTQLVLKALHLIRTRRLEMDASQILVAQAFMTIKKQLTRSGRQVTYTSGRSDELGHGDLAWAIMNALLQEPLGEDTMDTHGFLEIY